MFFIRKFKNSDAPRVNKAEFRHTLVKFGIILPVLIFDSIFNKFDADRSGTIEVDEFVVSVMNEKLDDVSRNRGILRSGTAASMMLTERPRTVAVRKGSSLKPIQGVQDGSFMLFGATFSSVERKFREALRQGSGFNGKYFIARLRITIMSHNAQIQPSFSSN